MQDLHFASPDISRALRQDSCAQSARKQATVPRTEVALADRRVGPQRLNEDCSMRMGAALVTSGTREGIRPFPMNRRSAFFQDD